MSENSAKDNVPLSNFEEKVRIPLYRRNLFPTNISLSAKDICELTKIISDANDEAIKIEIDGEDKNAEDFGDRKNNIIDLMRVEYELKVKNGDLITGQLPLEENDMPEELLSFFISNEQYAKRAVNASPLNHVNAFLSFEMPNLVMDSINLPSNPTQNRSVINIDGRNENWVIATTEKLRDFFNKKKVMRPIIHNSGIYDIFLYLFYLPIFISLLVRFDEYFLPFLSEKSIFLNVVTGIYILLLNLIFARFVFQFTRALFPPTEYFKSNAAKKNIGRLAIGTIMLSLFGTAIYDFVKYMIGIIL